MPLVQLEDVVRHPGRHVLHAPERPAALLDDGEADELEDVVAPVAGRRQLRGRDLERRTARDRRSRRTTSRPPSACSRRRSPARGRRRRSPPRRSAPDRRSPARPRRRRRGRAGGRPGPPRPSGRPAPSAGVNDLEQRALVPAPAACAHERPQRPGDAALAADHLADVLLGDVQPAGRRRRRARCARPAPRRACRRGSARGTRASPPRRPRGSPRCPGPSSGA